MHNSQLTTARHFFAQSVFMNNIHYKAFYRIKAKIDKNNQKLKVFSFLTILILIIQLICHELKFQSFLSVLSIIGIVVTGLTLINEVFNKEDLTKVLYQHRNTAEQYKTIRDEFLILITKLMEHGSSPEFETQLQKLASHYGIIGQSAFETEYEDYTNAQQGLGINQKPDEEFSWSDQEIDKILPPQLKLF